MFKIKILQVQGTVQEPISTEILAVVNKRYPGLKVDYKEVWSAKSSLVRGIRSSL